MYAIVKTGGKQYKVAVGDVVEVEKVVGAPGDTVPLPALLVVDGTDVTSDAAALAGITVSGEVVAHTKGPKIDILKYKNKTGYKRRLGHRQRLTQVRVTAIETGAVAGSAPPVLSPGRAARRARAPQTTPHLEHQELHRVRHRQDRRQAVQGRRR